ncbi:MAG TPA: hypothetical protein VIO14_13510 [Dehalococcoidia bacterium]
MAGEIVRAYVEAWLRAARDEPEADRLLALVREHGRLLPPADPRLRERVPAPEGDFWLVEVAGPAGGRDGSTVTVLVHFEPATRTLFLREARVTAFTRALAFAHGLVHVHDALSGWAEAKARAQGEERARWEGELRAWEAEIELADQASDGALRVALDELVEREVEERPDLVAYLRDTVIPRLQSLLPGVVSEEEAWNRQALLQAAHLFRYFEVRDPVNADAYKMRWLREFREEWNDRLYAS